MSETSLFETPQGRRIAYCRSRVTPDVGGPGVVFLGGFRSDMQGTKAVELERWAKEAGHAFLRFDYSGHGQSDGRFAEGCIGDWAQDAHEAIAALTEGPQVLVGSSMGGWIALLLARRAGLPIAGLVTIAAAPDFTEDGMWAGFTQDQRRQLDRDGQVALPSEYGEDLVITRRLIEDGRENLVLRQPLRLPFPVRMLQGTADADVDTSVALRLLDHAEGPDLRLLLVKGADHRFSTPDCLKAITQAIAEVAERRAPPR
ncbi:alpha/beta hydrolase [Brevirhabdus sp.]|uniref:alpha/beta hydrolase n=1 Tax=Brevirhabdus sp. TaxID=2004514 RepID=UPI00405807C1